MRRLLKTFAFVTLAAAGFVASAGARGYACQPCRSTLDLPRSLEKADLVAVVKRAGDAKRPETPGDDGVQCDELSVEGVLKGEFEGKKLTVRRWYGMCPYGVILGRGTYVVILVKASSSDYDMAQLSEGCEAAPGGKSGKAELFAPVEQGCAVKELAVESGTVEVEGVRLTLEEFRDKYGLRGGAAARAAPDVPFGARRSGAYSEANFFGLKGWPHLFEVTQ